MTDTEEIARLRWFLYEITVAWDCGDDDTVARLLNMVDAHQWDWLCPEPRT